MATEITPGNEVASKPSYGVTFGKKVSDGNYGGDDFSVWVSADVAPDATADDKYAALNDAANVAKALVYDHFKLEVQMDEAGVIREAEKAVTRAFPGTTDVSSPKANVAPTQLVGGVRVKGSQYGELPVWLLEAAGKDGVTEVYDNRGDLSDPAKASRPHFKATTGGRDAKAYWPPKGR